MLASPVADCLYDGLQCFSIGRQAVFGFRRDDGVYLTMNDAIGFKLTQLLCQHFWRGLGEEAAQFAEAQRAADEMPEDDSLIFASYDGKGRLNRTVET